jgi:hypothetical protein
MALRNYLYAKHSNDITDAKINKKEMKEEVRTHRSKTFKVIHKEDGTKECRNCVDCPKKLATLSESTRTPMITPALSPQTSAKLAPKITVSQLQVEVEHLKLAQEIEFTNIL